MMRKIVPDVIGDQNIREIPGTASAREAAELISKYQIGALLVTKNGGLEGIVTERDLVMKVLALGRDPDKTRVSQIMTRNPEAARADDTALSALERMQKEGFRHLPVMDGDAIIGIISIRDLYACAKDQLEEDIKHRDEFISGTGYGG